MTFEQKLIQLLQATAIKMDAPVVYGAFHFAIVAVMIAAAVAGALFVSKRDEKVRIRILALCGWFLVITEIYKQLFFYYVVNGGVYDYWFLPFQLCSVPMYLCIVLPFVRGRVRSTFLTFMLGYTFVSAVSTFIYPADLMRPYLLLTLHGFLWHGILLFISLVIAFSGIAELNLKGFEGSTVLFCILCCLAIVLNILTEPLAATASAQGIIHSYPNAFYLNPYHVSTQPMVGAIQNAFGIPVGMIIYVIAIILLAGGVDWCFSRRECSQKAD